MATGGRDYGTIFWAVVLVLFIVGAVAGVSMLAWPKIEALVFPTPTLEPGLSNVFPVRHNRELKCDVLARELYGPAAEPVIISALNSLEASGALPNATLLEDLEGWSAHWMFDAKQDRVEYWMYGAGESAGLVFELTIGCIEEESPIIEFSEVEVRMLPSQ